MTAENFCYWLKGYLELTDSKNLTEEQVKMINEHLNLVFNKVTPPLEKLKKDDRLLETQKKFRELFEKEIKKDEPSDSPFTVTCSATEPVNIRLC